MFGTNTWATVPYATASASSAPTRGTVTLTATRINTVTLTATKIGSVTITGGQ